MLCTANGKYENGGQIKSFLPLMVGFKYEINKMGDMGKEAVCKVSSPVVENEV